MKRPFRNLLVTAIIAAAAPLAFAVHPGKWVHTTEADYTPGKKENVVVTNLGDVKLSTGFDELAKMPEQASIVYDMQYAGGDLYLAAGPEAKLLVRKGDKVGEVAALPNEQIFALDVMPDGKLLIGISGARSRLAVLEDGKIKTLAPIAGVRYIWDVAVDKDAKKVYVATGTDGRLFSVDLTKVTPVEDRPASQPATKPATLNEAATTQPQAVGVKELYKATQANLLCLGLDGKGRVYAGTDTDGLVYRFTMNADGTAVPFVMMDAGEPEVGALLVMNDGTVYAGTADADQARPGRLEQPTAVESGRPEIPEPKKIESPNVPPKPEPKGTTPAPRASRWGSRPSASVEPATTDPIKQKIAYALAAQPSAAELQRFNDILTHDRPDRATVRQAVRELGLEADPILAPLADDKPAAKPGDKPVDEPTPEQRDRLRDEIRKRLEAAKKNGEVAPGGPAPQQSGGARPAPRPGGAGGRPGGAAGGKGAKEGNAIYKIDSDGVVTQVFRESVMILRILQDKNGKLLVATGNEGKIFRVDPIAEETTIIADLEPLQVPAMALDADGKVMLGTANPATVVRLGDGYAKKGTFTSAVLDANQISVWGKIHVVATIAEGTTLVVETRTGNVEDPDRAAWSPWNQSTTWGYDKNDKPLVPRETEIKSPPARFLQYRVTLIGTGDATAVLDRIDMTYVLPNQRPVIASVKTSYPGLPAEGSAAPSGGAPRPAPRPGGAGGAAGGDEPTPPPSMTVEWEASDPNADKMTYKLEYQAAGGTKWVPIADDLTTTSYEWQTKRVPDGRYILRVTASDAPDNTPDMAKTTTRRSDPVLIDNTPPKITLAGEPKIDGTTATIVCTIEDALSNVTNLHYAIDSNKDWQPVLPKDLIFDSTKEEFEFKIANLKSGPHVITLRATDAQNNPKYEAIQIEVK